MRLDHFQDWGRDTPCKLVRIKLPIWESEYVVVDKVSNVETRIVVSQF